MSKRQIDDYLAASDEPQRSTLKALRKTILEIIPAAEECITYGVPTFSINGKGIAGFAACRTHCSYYPMSGSVLSQLGREVAGYKTSSGALRFAIDKPLPKQLVKKLISTRIAEIKARKHMIRVSRRPSA